ncbi:MAG TPA: hypothetical protein VLE91_02930 [Candidatus Saccharimonadales bacterium]|nr:hypothetical protein [Candidatus Saccharimonadales bacterium]
MKAAVFVFLALLVSFTLLTPVFAQGVSGVANNMRIDDTDAKPGDILSVADGKIVRSAKVGDPAMFGVVVQFPTISYGDKTDTTVAVLSSGRADVHVSAAAGAIKTGDPITTSDKAGVGQKGSAGYILGKALADYSDTSQDGTIPVLIGIGIFSTTPNTGSVLGQLLGALSIGLSSSQNFPLILKYISAALIGGITFIIAAFTFVRFMRSGLEAIGRNPLAKGTIIAGMMVNAGIVLILTVAGFGIAIAIIAF